MPTKTKIKILLADDHQVVRMGLAAIIAAESDLVEVQVRLTPLAVVKG